MFRTFFERLGVLGAANRAVNLLPARPTLEILEDRTVPVLIGSELPPGMIGGMTLATLSGFVYCDDNDDGIKDAGEPGLTGVTVVLSQRGLVIQTTTTNADGFYLFADLRPGRYDLTEGAIPPGANVVGDGRDTRGTIAGPGRKSPGRVGQDSFTRIVLRAGQVGINYNFGELCAAPGPLPTNPAIDIEKFTDGQDADTPIGPVNGVGDFVTFTYEVRNTGDVPLANVVVIDDNGTPANPADDFQPLFLGGDTDGDGLLDLDEVWNYEAMAIVVAGQYRNDATVTGENEGRMVTDTDPSHHFGLAGGSIDVGWVWDDLDGDGFWDPEELGLDNWMIELLRDGAPVATSMTMTGGMYWFPELEVGIYTIRLVPMTGWTQTFPAAGNPHVVDLRVGHIVTASFGETKLPNFGVTRVVV